MSSSAAIDASLKRIARIPPSASAVFPRRRSGPGEGWFSAAELLASDGAPAGLLSQIRGMFETPADHIRAEWLFESYARAIADLGVLFIVAERRLPDLSPENLLMASRGGLIVATAVVSEKMIVLGGDPADAEPGITRAEDWQGLAGELRSGFSNLVSPFLSWFVRHRLRQEKTLWSAAADRLAQSLVWSGQVLAQPDFVSELAREVLADSGPMAIPLETGIDNLGNKQHLRSTCCLAYRAAGGSLCFSCPLNR